MKLDRHSRQSQVFLWLAILLLLLSQVMALSHVHHDHNSHAGIEQFELPGTLSIYLGVTSIRGLDNNHPESPGPAHPGEDCALCLMSSLPGALAFAAILPDQQQTASTASSAVTEPFTQPDFQMSLARAPPSLLRFV